MSQQYERIMVAIDGSYESELAFIKGVHVAKRNNAQLLLVHVIDTRALQSVATFVSILLNACLLVHLLNTFSVTQKLTCSLFVTLKKHFSHLSQAPLVLFSYKKRTEILTLSSFFVLFFRLC